MTDSSDMTITHKAILDRAKQDALEYMPDLPKLPDSQLYADSARGIYIPQHFAKFVDRSKLQTSHNFEVLSYGPEHESYWDVWADVLDNAILTDPEGRQWRLYQDGDLWIVPLNTVEEWEAYIDDLESLDAFEIAHESAEWDWVIYTHRAMELCQAVPSAVLHDAESEWLDLYGGSTIDDSFGLYEMACQLANLIVARAIAEAVEDCREELLELANTQLRNMES